jgi:hypothetical protein
MRFAKSHVNVSERMGLLVSRMVGASRIPLVRLEAYDRERSIAENAGMHSRQKGSGYPQPPSAYQYPTINRNSGHEWPKRLLWPIAFFLKTGEPTDTVDRLFDSRHVNDLRLIAATAFCVTVVVFAIALMNAISFCAWDWSTQTFTNYYQVIAHIANRGGKHFIGVFGPTLVIFGTILGWAYQRGSNRLGIVDLFACEIDTLCRVVTIIEMVRNLTDNQKDSTVSQHFTSEENYFPVLDGNTNDLQSLEANVVINITAFYTFMKTVRDSFRKEADIRDAAQRKESLKALVYMLYLTLESGRKAMDDLVEFEPTHTERTIVILISELKAYEFLRLNYQKEDEMHYNRLILRGPLYRRLVGALDSLLDGDHEESLAAVKRGNLDNPTYAQSQWSAALQLRDELDKSFAELESKVSLECESTGKRITAGFAANTGSAIRSRSS